MNPAGMALIGPLALEAMRAAGWHPHSVGGLTLGADPVSYAIAYASTQSAPTVRAFTVRKEAKLHGTGKLVEGPLDPSDRVVVIEDVITTGSSALRAIAAVRDAGATVVGVLTVVDRQEGGRAAIEAAGYPVIALATGEEVVQRLDSLGIQAGPAATG